MDTQRSRACDSEGKTPTSTSKQVIGLFFSPTWLHDYADLEAALAETGHSGNFGTVVGYAWHMHHAIGDELVHNAVKFAADAAHRNGLKFVMDMDWSHWATPYVEQNPEIAMWMIVPAEGICCNGHFDIRIPYVNNGSAVQVAEISAAYAYDTDENPFVMARDQYDLQQNSYATVYPQPATDDDCVYTPHKPNFGKHYYLHLSGRVKDRSVRKVRFYIAMESYKYPDVAHPAYLKIQLDLLERYRDVPLDGVAWDEPGKPNSLHGYKAGRGFLAFFKERCGYDLRARLLDLDKGTSVTAFQTRRDYYATLAAMNHRAQAEFNQKAMEIYGADIFMGNHQTFSGLAIDLRAGCSDYFQMGKVLSAAFTDTGWDVTPPSETTYNYALAEGLRKELKKPCSIVNDWSRMPRKSWYDYYTRLKMLFGHDWLMIFVSRWGEGHATFPWSRHWPDVVRNAGQLEAFGAFTKRQLSGLSEMAVWHSPQATANLQVSQYHHVRLWMTGNNNLAHEAMIHSRFFDYVSGNAVEQASVADGCILMNGVSYRRLALPCAVVVTQCLWNKVRECVASGVELVFFGPPPRWVIETGEDLAGEFSRICGVEPFTYEQYDDWMTAQKPVPQFTDWEPAKFDFTFPLTPVGSTLEMSDNDGNMIGVRNHETGVTYFTSPDPRERFFQHLERPRGVYPDISHCGSGSYRLMLNPVDPTVCVLVCIAPLNNALNECFTYQGTNFFLKGGTWAVLQFENGRIIDQITDNNTVLIMENLEKGTGS
ncbi:MAG: hypothetical protein WCI51_06310 [Lentisphaerota bacterium]